MRPFYENEKKSRLYILIKNKSMVLAFDEALTFFITIFSFICPFHFLLLIVTAF